MLTQIYFFNHLLHSLSAWVLLPAAQDVPCFSVFGQQDRGPGLVQISCYGIFWVIWNESSRTQTDPRSESQHCGEASADNWRILAKMRCFNNRWQGAGLARSPSILLLWEDPSTWHPALSAWLCNYTASQHPGQRNSIGPRVPTADSVLHPDGVPGTVAMPCYARAKSGSWGLKNPRVLS